MQVQPEPPQYTWTGAGKFALANGSRGRPGSLRGVDGEKKRVSYACRTGDGGEETLVLSGSREDYVSMAASLFLPFGGPKVLICLNDAVSKLDIGALSRSSRLHSP